MKISGLQLFWMIAGMEVGMTIVMTFNPAFHAAKQDAWISILVAEGIGFIVTIVSYTLTSMYPNETFVQFSRTILGKWAGSVIVFIYIVQWYSIIPIILRQYSDLIKLILLEHTPVQVIMVLMLVTVIYAVANGGIESVGRCSQVVVPIIVVSILLTLLMSLHNIKFENILPVFADSGAGNIVKGALPAASYLGHAIDITMLGAFLQNPNKELRYGLWAIVFSFVIVLLTIVMTVLTINPDLAAIEWYPFFFMTGKIDISHFIENLDALVVVVWISSVFIKLSIYYFIASYGTAQWLKIKNWKTMIWILAPLMLSLGLLPRHVNDSVAWYLNHYWLPVVLPFNMVLIPLLLIFIGKIRRIFNRMPS